AENQDFIAFLDISPNARGHTLCVPKAETDKIFEMDEAAYLNLMQFSYTVAKALQKTVACERVGISVIGLEVPHVHVHLIPINKMEDMAFTHKVEMGQSELATLARAIAAKV
ncbi:MAG: HIT family protein, partial [Marinirhabdus sp.]